MPTVKVQNETTTLGQYEGAISAQMFSAQKVMFCLRTINKFCPALPTVLATAS
jgi:hypothetical protein